MHPRARDSLDPADGDAEPVRPVLAALGEDADEWPVLAPAGVPRAGLDRRVGHAIEHEDHLGMAEIAEPGE